jgi:hypothetical protein
MPLVPVLPSFGVLADLALVSNLPPVGGVVGAALTVALVVASLVWGGCSHVDELVEEDERGSRPSERIEGGRGRSARHPSVTPVWFYRATTDDGRW